VPKRYKDLRRRAREEIKTDEDLILLSIFSALIGTFGYYFDNMYILIGAMLVSPLFDPLISFVIFLASKRWKNAIRALYSFILIVLLSLIFSVILFYFLNRMQIFTSVVSYVPIPTIEQFMLAVVLGMTGMFMWMWPKTSNTSAGVAVSVTLFPPLISISNALITYDSANVRAYTSILILNVLGIIMGAFLALVMKYRVGDK